MTSNSNGGVSHWKDGPLEDGHAHSSYSGGEFSNHITPASSYNVLSPSMLAALQNSKPYSRTCPTAEQQALQGAMPYLQPPSSGPTYVSHHLAASQLQSLRGLPDGHMHGHEFRPDPRLGYGHISASAHSSQAFPFEDSHIGGSSASVHEDGLSEDHSNDRRQSNKKTEMNRKAQQRYRRRKKEMFEEQQRLNVELALKCNELAKAHAQSQARTLFLEDMLNIPHQSTEPAGQAMLRTEASVQAFADSMLELVHLLMPEQPLGLVRQLLLRSTTDMLQGIGGTIAFVRRMLVQQLAQCLASTQHPHLDILYTTMCKLMGTYVNMVQRAGASDLQATLTYLSLSAAESEQTPPANDCHWRNVLASVSLQPEHVRQLLDMHQAYKSNVSRLADNWRSLSSALSTLGPSATCITQSPSSSLQVDSCLEMHRSTMAEERQATFQFVKMAMLVLDPMQHARIMLASFPYAPNMAALCALLLQQHPNHQQPQPGLQLQAPEQYPAAAEDGSPGGKISPHRQANGYGTQCPLPDGLGRHPLGKLTEGMGLAASLQMSDGAPLFSPGLTQLHKDGAALDPASLAQAFRQGLLPKDGQAPEGLRGSGRPPDGRAPAFPAPADGLCAPLKKLQLVSSCSQAASSGADGATTLAMQRDMSSHPEPLAT